MPWRLPQQPCSPAPWCTCSAPFPDDCSRRPPAGTTSAGGYGNELYYVLITQPLVPLYFFIGRKMGGGRGTPVIFVHGYFQNRADFWWMARQFRKASKGPLYGFNSTLVRPGRPERPAAGRIVERVCAERRREGDSGGSFARWAGVRRIRALPEGQRRVAHCITVGTPHAGVKWRGPILGRVARNSVRASSTPNVAIGRSSRRP